MTRYVVRRALGAVPLAFGVATLVFFVIQLAPGDPGAVFIRRGMSREAIDAVRSTYGLDQPVLVQYWKWLLALLRGDLGYSFHHQEPVARVLGAALPNTLLLSGVALLAAFAVGVAVGVVQAVRQYSTTDSVASVVSLVFYSMPSFWLALMLVLVFSKLAGTVWDWPFHFPASGTRSVDYTFLPPGARLLDRLWHLVLPATALTLVLAAGVARFMRSGMLEILNQDFIRAARAKGLPERTVVLKHALRNALLPVITLFGLYLPVLFTGTVFVEKVFQWPGMGLAIVDGIATLDYPVVVAGTLVFALLVVAGNLLADLLAALVDPRVRHG